MQYKLGKLPRRIDKRTLQFMDFLVLKNLPSLPDSYDVDQEWTNMVDTHMFGNDTYGDCVIAGRAHMTLRFEDFEQSIVIAITDQDVENEYFKETGGADAGLNMLTSLNEWRQSGWEAAGEHYDIHAYAQLDISNHDELRYCVYLLRGAYTGFNVPQSAMDQFNTGQLWTVVADSPIIGGHCFTGDTKIPLLDGTEITLEELAEKYKDKDFWVYTLDDDGNIVAGHAHSPRLTRKNVKVIRIRLDNGEIITCTPDHLFMIRNGEYQEASSLKVGDSLMPLYRKLDKFGYELSFNPRTNRYSLTHNLISRQNRKGLVVHHCNFNKRDNRPENLRIMTWDEHTKLHSESSILLRKYSKSEKGRNKSKELMEKLWADKQWRMNRLTKNRENLKSHGFETWAKEDLKNQPHLKITTEKQRLARQKNALVAVRKRMEKRLKNHKIISIEDSGYEDVYDFEVDNYHNFALSSGVFVHNCVYIVGYNITGPVCVTWGKKQQMDWNFWDTYFDEAYGIVQDKAAFCNPATDPVDVNAMDAELSKITSNPPNPSPPSPSPCPFGRAMAKIGSFFCWLLRRKGRFYYMNPK